MGSCRFAALIVLLLAFALLPDPASARVLQGQKPSSSEGAPAPTTSTGGSEESAGSKELGKSSAVVQNTDTGKQHQETPPLEITPKDTPPPPPPPPVVAEDKGKEGGAVQGSAQPVPSTNVHKESPSPGGPELTDGTVREGGESLGKKRPTEEIKTMSDRCDDPVDTCLIGGELSACLQVFQTGSTGSFVVVQNTGQNTITVNVKATSDISIEQNLPPLSLGKGDSKKVNINYSKSSAGEITVKVGNEHCVLRIRQPVSDWQQQFQQLAAYATRMDPIYGAYLFAFTVVLVGVVCACCKFARRKRDNGVPYQQLEMGSQALNSSSADNTTSTVDGWEDGWDDDWDDEEVPAKPSDKRPTASVPANGGLSLRSQTNSKDGWDVDWDD